MVLSILMARSLQRSRIRCAKIFTPRSGSRHSGTSNTGLLPRQPGMSCSERWSGTGNTSGYVVR